MVLFSQEKKESRPKEENYVEQISMENYLGFKIEVDIFELWSFGSCFI